MWIRYFISLCLFGILAYWSYRILYPIELLEYRLAEQGLDWYAAPLIARLLIGCLWVLALFFLLGINPRNRLPKALIIMLGLMGADVVWEFVVSDRIIVPCYGCYGGVGIYITVGVYLFVFLACFYFIKFRRPADLPFVWLKYVLGTLVLSLPFILNPVWPQDFTQQATAVSVNRAKLLTEGIQELEEQQLIAFFSLNCRYCKRAARKMAVAQVKNPDFPKILICFPGNDPEVESFFNKTNTSFDYKLFSPEQFSEMVGRSLPWIVGVENGAVVKQWSGQTFNFHSLRMGLN